jgi:hypothetical protein
LVIFLLFVGNAARLFWLQIVLHQNFVALADKQHVVVSTVDPARGEILARDHTNVSQEDLYPLAANKVYYEVYVDPSKITQPQNTADALAGALGLQSADIIERLKKTADNYEPIKHKVTEEQLAAVKKIALPGIAYKKETWRFYPDKDIGAQLLGFYGVRDDKKQGIYGLEAFWDKELSGQSITSKFERTLKNGQYQNWHKLSVSANVRGYRLTTVTRGDGTRKVVKVGRLVLEAFLGKSPLLVRHLNDVRDDDRLSNLAYGTCKDNSRDALLNNKILRGEANGYATATESLVRQVRKLKASGCTYREIQELLGVKKSQACHICTGRTWRHVT